MDWVIKIDGKYVKGFDGQPNGKVKYNGWYTTSNDEIGEIEFTNDVNEAYIVGGRINFKSVCERIYDRMSMQGLTFSRLEFIEKE